MTFPANRNTPRHGRGQRLLAGLLAIGVGLPVAGMLQQAVGGYAPSFVTGPVVNASGQEFVVDVANGNSPYAVNVSDTFLSVTVGNNGVGMLNHTAGTLTVSSSLVLGNNPGSNGTYTLSDAGSLSTGFAFVGLKGSGSFNQSGGSFTTNGFGLYLGYNSGSSGTYNLSGTGSLSTGAAYVGNAGSGSFIQSGGSFTTNGFSLYLGNNPGNSGSYALSGGTLSTGRTEVSDNSNTSTFTQSGGIHTTTTLSLASFSTISQGTYNLNGGTLLVSQVTSGGNNVRGTSTFNFNGGTLQAGASSTTFFQDLTTANVQAGGAKVDTAGFAVTISQPLLHDAALNSTADGGLTKLGAGTLTLNGINTYTGATTVNAGLLLINGSTAAASTISVASGATLGGSGIIGGSVTVNSGGTLAPGNSPGRLTLGGSLTLAAGSTLAIELGGTLANGSTSQQYDQIFLSGLLTLSGNLAVVAVNGFTLTPGQTFILLDQTGSGPATTTFFANAPGNIYTDAAGNRFLVNYAANADGGLVANDVILTVLTVVPEPGTWKLLLAGSIAVVLGLGYSQRRSFHRVCAASTLGPMRSAQARRYRPVVMPANSTLTRTGTFHRPANYKRTTSTKSEAPSYFLSTSPRVARTGRATVGMDSALSLINAG